MNRRDFIKTSLTGAALAALPRWGAGEEPPVAAKKRPPNVLLIFIDDLGYGELGCYGGKEIPTPNIDAFAATAVRMTDGYVTAPWCAPSRVSLLTGCYPQRWGCYDNPSSLIPADRKIIAEYLRDAGYVTGMCGKWHLELEKGPMPDRRGFMEVGDVFNGPQSAYVRKDGRYSTTKFTDTAIAFMEKHRDRPFFYYLPYNAVHSLLHIAPGYEDRFKEIKDEKRRQFATMLTALDDNIGRLMKRLRELGLDENTLVFLLSDNGGYPYNTSVNTPLRGYKCQLAEGGIRVPFLVRWPGRLKPNTEYRQPVIAHDILPTALAAAGVALPDGAKVDGVNLLPFLTGADKGDPHGALYWELDGNAAVRAGQWKFSVDGKKPRPKLYDLAADIGEKKDLSAAQPEKTKDLLALWEKWRAANQPMRRREKPATAKDKGGHP